MILSIIWSLFFESFIIIFGTCLWNQTIKIIFDIEFIFLYFNKD